MTAAAAQKAVTRWTTRIIPFILGGCLGLTMYTVVKRICRMSIACPWSRDTPPDPYKKYASLTLSPVVRVTMYSGLPPQ